MTEYVLSLSYGKDSLACLGAIEQLGWPLTRIVHTEIWATEDIPAELPPMVEFKKKADAIIKEKYGIEVEHVCAMRERERESFESRFYTSRKSGKYIGSIAGWPLSIGPWCRKLKYENTHIRRFLLQGKKSEEDGRNEDIRLSDSQRPMVQAPQDEDFSSRSLTQGADKNTVVQYIGFAVDEPERLKTLEGTNKVSPLAAIGWTEAECMEWCRQNDLLSPIYESSNRGGCWFCHYQGLDQLRLLRKNYPEYWALMLKWDNDSPTTFSSDGRTLKDYDKRFELEEQGKVPTDKKFRWKMIEEQQE